MLEKKLVEKEVEVTVVKKEKRLVEVYSFEGKDYHSLWELKGVLARRMGDAYEKILDFSTDAVNLVWNTNVATFQDRAKQRYHADKLYGSGKLLEHFKKMEELIMIYSQLDD